MHDTVLTRNVNTYIAALIITVAGAGASVLIIHIANAPSAPVPAVQVNADAAQLQKSILGK